MGKKYTSGPRYWNVPVLVNTGTFLVYQYCPKMWYLRSLEHASVIQKLTILEHKNGIVLSNTHVPVSGTWSILFPHMVPYSMKNTSIMFPLKNRHVLPKLMLLKVDQYQLKVCIIIVKSIIWKHWEKNLVVMVIRKQVLCSDLMTGIKHDGNVHIFTEGTRYNISWLSKLYRFDVISLLWNSHSFS